jgi:hypothetical protein
MRAKHIAERDGIGSGQFAHVPLRLGGRFVLNAVNLADDIGHRRRPK